MINIIVKIIFSHLVGDYVLQNQYIAESKGINWYHLFVHCSLYCLPFFLFFGLDWKLGVIFVTHILIDSMKARYRKISYPVDQVLHYVVALIYLVN